VPDSTSTSAAKPYDLGAGIALELLKRPLKYGVSTAAGYCQMFARRYVEVRYGKPDHSFYRAVGGVVGVPSAAQLARLIQARHPHWVVSSPKPGDLAYWLSCFPGDLQGHVAVYADYNGNGKLEYAQNSEVKVGIVKPYQGNLSLNDASVQDGALGHPDLIVRVPSF